MPVKTKYLRQTTTGRIFGWREVLSKRPDMEDYEWPVGAGGPVVPDHGIIDYIKGSTKRCDALLYGGTGTQPVVVEGDHCAGPRPVHTTDLNVMSEDEIRAMAAEMGFKFDRRFKIASVIKAIEERRALTHKTFDLKAE